MFKLAVRKGSNVPSSKLTEKQVRFVLRAYRFGISQKRISERVGVSAPAIHQIIKGKGWKHLTEGKE
jgi:predicted DNA binding protein